ncbi:MAG: DUF4860 domain-containing protein [Oscillospiraceae bacterium]|nr:DUF4860 domain-containing protein [Oscillospiraceae bacterium]
MRKNIGDQSISTVFVLIIFCIFAVSVLMVLMLGVSIYQNLTEISREEQDQRLALSYIRTKVRSNDESERLHIGEFHGHPALIYHEVFGGRLFRTVIYHYNGWLNELFSEADLDFSPADGTQIMPLDELRLEELGEGLIMVATGTRSLLLHTRTRLANTASGSEPLKEVLPR